MSVAVAALWLGSIPAVPSLAQGDPPDRSGCSTAKMRVDVRPDTDAATPVTVGIRMVDLMRIDDVLQTLTGLFAVRLRWEDPRLVGLEGCELSLDEVWSPQLLFYNSGRRFATRKEVVHVELGGAVTYLQIYQGTFATYHNLRDFPFDRQRFRISLLPTGYDESQVEFLVDEKFTGRREILNISDWEIGEARGKVGREELPAFGGNYSRFDFELSAQRIASYYVWKVMLPLCLIVAMSWAVFWINPARFGPQIGLSATSMLTLIAFMFATTNMLPKLGYFTTLDFFIAGSTILVFLALAESLTTSYLVSIEREELGLRIDRAARLVFPMVAALAAMLLIAST